MPMTWPPPGRFSTTTGLPRPCCSGSAISRANWSAWLPAATETMMVIWPRRIIVLARRPGLPAHAASDCGREATRPGGSCESSAPPVAFVGPLSGRRCGLVDDSAARQRRTGWATVGRRQAADLRPHSRAEAMSAPSRSASSFFHTTCATTYSRPAKVPKPQSVEAMTRSRSPTAATASSIRRATTSGCSTKLRRGLDHAGHRGSCPAAAGCCLSAVVFVGVARIGELDRQRADLGRVERPAGSSPAGCRGCAGRRSCPSSNAAARGRAGCLRCPC